MHSIMNRKDDEMIGRSMDHHHHQTHKTEAPIELNKNREAGNNTSYLNMNLQKCLETIQQAATQQQQNPHQQKQKQHVDSTNSAASPKAESNKTTAVSSSASSAFEVAARELVSGFTSQDMDDVLHRRGTSNNSSNNSYNSEEPSETSCLDKEVRRLRVLKSYLGVLDCEYGNKFERLTALASRIFGVPMAQVSVADLDKQYCVSSRGFHYLTARKSPFCSYAVLADCDILVVSDATKDSRFQQDPQVTTNPKVRFYAGAPLICPEGYRLGTLCVMDTKPRLKEVALEEKQSLMELAGMAMETLVDLRTKKTSALKDPSQQIACTAHDLLTPLTGIALSLSLLKEDEALQKKLTEQQRDMIETAANCSAVMNSICHKTMNFFRDQGRPPDGELSSSQNAQRRQSGSTTAAGGNNNTNKKVEPGPGTVNVADFVKNLNMIMEPFPKHVPIIITVDPAVPREFICDDMKIFRSATNFLSNACAKTEKGSIRFKIFTRTNVEKMPEIVFECEDTGPGVDVRKYAYLFKPVREESDPLRVSKSRTVLEDVPSGACRDGVRNTGLGLYSVATQISSIGGKYGFSPRGQRKTDVTAPTTTTTTNFSKNATSSSEKGTGSIFWFAIPLVTPDNLFVSRSRAGILSPIESATETSKVASKRPSGIADDNLRRQRMLDNARGMTFANAGTSDLANVTSPKVSPSSDRAHERRLSADDALEAYASSRGSLSASKKRPRSPMSSGRKMQALVIEDSIVVSKSLARVLTKLGFEVTQAMNGMEGLKSLKAALFDLVLCDFLMPVMDGLDCIQQYRQWEEVNRPYFKQYIVGMSAHASPKDIEQGIKIGMNEFRSKPVSYKQLTELKNGKGFQRASMELDKLGHEIECLKRRKTELESDQKSSSESSDRKVCLVVEGGTVVSKLANLASETIGWKIVAVKDKDSALGLLKMRNWDAVLVDDELDSSRCIAIFREWEKMHRVNRQKNVVLMSANFVQNDNHGAFFQVPTGFDGALGKPIELNALQSFLEKAQTTCDIVTR